MDRMRVKYNRLVKDKVQEISVPAAEMLNRQGSELGWWNNIHYWYTKGWDTGKTARMIVDLYNQTTP